MKGSIRTLALILLAGAPAALSGCFLFTGGDEQKDKGAMTSAMDASGANSADAVADTPPSPWRSIELREGDSSGSLLPLAAIVVSALSMGLVVVHWALHRRSPPRAG